MVGLSTMIGVFSQGPAQVKDALLAQAAAEPPHLLEPQPAGLYLAGSGSHTLLIFTEPFARDQQLARQLSRTLGVTVICLRMHEEDLWMFVLYSCGAEVAWFDPLPDLDGAYLPASERRKWVGDARLVASHIPGITARTIENYFVSWDNDKSEVEVFRKAYPDDDYGIGDAWQVCDFVRRIGLPAPLDPKGRPVGELVWSRSLPAAADRKRKPWWKIW